MNISRWHIFLSLVLSVSVFAQVMENTDRKSTSTQSTTPTIQSQLPMSKFVQDGPVDPKEYIVGPGDIFSVNIWSSTPLMFQIPVTPEGSVVIPTVAEVNITGMTLELAKKTVMTEIRKKYISGSASFTLFAPRSFTVTVLGSVLNEGSIIVQSTQRIDAALALANDVRSYKEQNGLTVLDELKTMEIQKKIQSSSYRRVTVKRKNGSVVTADIEKYFASFNTSYNPLLLDGDIIIVQPNNIEKDHVAIYGAVVKEGKFEFVDGDSASHLIAMAGGCTPLADLKGAVLYRDNSDGRSEQISINIEEILSGKNDVLLHRGDRITIRHQNVYERGGSVTILGEVSSPGSYSIFRDSTTLSQIVAMSGGLTKYASLTSASIVREIQIEDRSQEEFNMLKRGQSSAEDTLYFGNEISLKHRAEISSVDFVSLFEKNDLSKDVVLQDGDRIIIPSKMNSVYVFGEVKRPGSIAFQKGKTVQEYISMAGGITEHAESGDIRIVKAATKQWLIPSETTIEEGDYIWIPKEPYRSFSYYLGIYSQVFGIVGTVATLILLVTR